LRKPEIVTQQPANRQEWLESDYAQQYFACEQSHLELGVRQAVSPCVLQIGDYLVQSVVDDLDLPFLVRQQCSNTQSTDLVADPAFLPFASNSFGTVILPHVLEGHELPHQVLREAHRVLTHEGHIVITGFNPISLMGLQRFIRPKAVCHGKYYSAKRVIDWLQLLGFEIAASSMFQYAPLLRSSRLRNAFQFLNSVGDRWLPMTGGGYMITAKKREAAGTLVGEVRFKKPKRKLVAATATKTSNKALMKDSQ